MAQRAFLPRSAAVREARQFVLDVFVYGGLDATEALLVVSELASNAVCHGRTRFTVDLTRSDDHVLIEVSDENPQWPVVTTEPDGGGRGLMIVTRVAARWGCLPGLKSGKTVWAEVVARLSEVPAEPGSRRF